MNAADERYQLPEELRMARNLVKDYIQNEIIPLEQELDQDAISLPDEDFDRLTPMTKEMGLWCMGVAEEYGGAGLSLCPGGHRRGDGAAQGWPVSPGLQHDGQFAAGSHLDGDRRAD